MDINESIGKTIESVIVGKYGMCNVAYCINFTDGTSTTFAGEHDENTIIVDGNQLE